jgi:hypothetical protein
MKDMKGQRETNSALYLYYMDLVHRTYKSHKKLTDIIVCNIHVIQLKPESSRNMFAKTSEKSGFISNLPHDPYGFTT